MNAFADLPPTEPTKKANAFADLPPTEPERVNEPSLLVKAGDALRYGQDLKKTLGSAALKGWGGMVDFPATAANWGGDAIEYVTGLDVPDATPPTQRNPAIRATYDKLTTPAIPVGENTFVDSAAKGVEYASGGPFKSDLYAGIGAGTGQLISDYTGVPYLADVLGIAGGFKGASGSAASESDVIDSAAHKLIEGRLGGSNSAEQAELAQQTQQAIINGLRNPEKAAQSGGWLGTPSTATGPMKNPNQTMAELTGNRALYGLENTVGGTENRAAGRGYAMYDAITANKKALSDDIVNTVAPQSSIPTRATSDAAEAQIAALRGDADVAEQVVLTADEVAATARKRFDGLPNTAESSKKFSAAYNTLDKDLKKHADNVWKEFDGAPPIDMTGVKAELKDYLDGREMPNEMVQDLFNKYKKKVFSQVSKWDDGPIEPKSIQYVLTKIKDEVSTAAAAGTSDVLTKEIGMFGTQLENILKASPATSAYRKGVEATSELYKRARPERVKTLRNSPSVETLADRFKYSGSKGAETARNVLDSADAKTIEASHDNLRSLAKQEGVDPAFMTKYAGYLDNPKFGRLKNEFTEIIAKQDLAAGAKDSAAKVTGLAKAAEASTLKKFAEKPEAVIDGMLKNGKANSKELKSLLASAVANGTEKSFKNLMTERIKGKLFGDIAFPEATGGRSGSAVSFGKMRDTLVEAGIYTPKEADRIAESLDRVKALDLRKEATNTQLQQTLNAVEGLSVSAAAVLTAKATGQSSLTMVGALRKAFKARALVKKNNTDVIKRVEEFLISPEKYLDGVKASKTLDENVNTIATHVMGASVAADSDGKDEQEQR